MSAFSGRLRINRACSHAKGSSRSAAFVFAIIVLSAWSACLPSLPERECFGNDDCPGDRVCSSGRCAVRGEAIDSGGPLGTDGAAEDGARDGDTGDRAPSDGAATDAASCDTSSCAGDRDASARLDRDVGPPEDAGASDAAPAGDAGTPGDGQAGDSGTPGDGQAGDAGTPGDGQAGDSGTPDAGLPGDASTADAGTLDGGGACPWPWEATNIDPCAQGLAAPIPSPFTENGAYRYDTDRGEILSPSAVTTTPPSAVVPQIGGGDDVRVIAFDAFNLALGTQLVITGSRPLVIVVHGDSHIDGAIDAKAAPVPGCLGSGVVGGSTGNNDIAGGGGGGGSHGAYGGAGGFGFGMAGMVGSGGAPGTTFGAAPLAPLSSGCPGGSGGGANASPTDPPYGYGGQGGAGGGALQLIVRGGLNITGSIAANGRGGEGGYPRDPDEGGGGGGGGGSGGGIFLEADSVDLSPSARLCANGGSGGEGAQTTRGGSGADGLCSTMSAQTTNISPRGGDGGAGGAGGFPDGASGFDGLGAGGEGGGGGGGGGVGRIRIRSVSRPPTISTMEISPAFVP